MKYNKVVALFASAMVLVSITGCRKYLDVNTNPNVVQDLGPEFLLPSAQLEIASAVGVDLQINGSIWAQHWTQSPASSQYKIYEQYSPNASTYDRVWTLLYSSALTDLDRMERRAEKDNKRFYVGVSKLLKAYTYQILADGWNDVPFSEALKGQPEDGGIVSPRFDMQSAVYDGITILARDGMTILNALPATTTITGDLMYSGSRDAWRRFGNTLLLKIYLRLTEKNPAKAQAGITALYATGPSFIGLNQDARIAYITTSQNQNPLYAEMVGLNKVQNLVASATVLDSMTKGNTTVPADRRATIFFKPVPQPSPALPIYVGLRQGFYSAPSSTQVAVPSTAVGGDALNEASATAPVKFISSYESLFLQTEVIARGYRSGNADSLFRTGIRNSFLAYGLTQVVADSYAVANYWGQYPASGTVAQKVRHIITQKWFSMTGNQGFEAWTEWRRTGYPDWFRVSANSIIGTSASAFPRRLFYPDVEVQRNQNFPGQKLITDKVDWDIR